MAVLAQYAEPGEPGFGSPADIVSVVVVGFILAFVIGVPLAIIEKLREWRTRPARERAEQQRRLEDAARAKAAADAEAAKSPQLRAADEAEAEYERKRTEEAQRQREARRLEGLRKARAELEERLASYWHPQDVRREWTERQLADVKFELQLLESTMSGKSGPAVEG